jgi:hypothetical protein
MKDNECMILLAKRELIKGVHDYDEVIRHEQGHCNGWRHGIVIADKPAWPRVIDKVADNRTEDAKTQKPSVEKKPRVKPAENAPTARPTARTAERPARQAHMPQPPWPLVAVSTILSTPFHVVATLTGRLR